MQTTPCFLHQPPFLPAFGLLHYKSNPIEAHCLPNQYEMFFWGVICLPAHRSVANDDWLKLFKKPQTNVCVFRRNAWVGLQLFAGTISGWKFANCWMIWYAFMSLTEWWNETCGWVLQYQFMKRVWLGTEYARQVKNKSSCIRAGAKFRIHIFSCEQYECVKSNNYDFRKKTQELHKLHSSNESDHEWIFCWFCQPCFVPKTGHVAIVAGLSVICFL